jgi:diaminopimelate epimerase
VNEIRFTKLQGMGNDFLVVQVDDVASLPGGAGVPPANRLTPSSSADIQPAELAIKICNRNYGAGADGLIFVSRSRDGESDFTSRIFNSDGSEAGVSGNGTRCLAAFLSHAALWSDPEVNIATAAGVKRGRLISRQGMRFEFEFDMGKPDLSSRSVPMTLDRPLDRVVRYPLHLGGDMFEVTCLSMGNPQCVIFVRDLDAVTLQEIGPLIEHHPVFPDRANVEFAKAVARDEIEIRIWERGAGHTLSSGTGSCASAVAAALNGLTDRSVTVRTEGGALRVVWRDDDTVALTASAEVIYEGRWLGSGSEPTSSP